MTSCVDVTWEHLSEFLFSCRAVSVGSWTDHFLGQLYMQDKLSQLNGGEW